jgi:hypothetical protein
MTVASLLSSGQEHAEQHLHSEFHVPEGDERATEQGCQCLKRKGDKNNQDKDSGEGKDHEKAEEKQAGSENEGNSTPELTVL